MSEKDKIEEIIRWFAEVSGGRLAYTLAHCLPRCESPIEGIMLAALMAVAREAYWCQLYSTPVVCSTEHPRSNFLTGRPTNKEYWLRCYIAPQFEISGYRVDFCLLFATSDLSSTFHIVVECDGHEWHDKTPEQAQRDKARDRAILIAGFPVMRFTGSEIHQDPLQCAREVFAAATREWHRGILAADHYSLGDNSDEEAPQ